MQDASLDIYSLIGFLGTACIIAAYAYLTLKDAPNPLVLHGTNLAGAGLLTISLLVHTNWPSLVLEGFWAAIALFGIWKAVRTGRKGQEREA
ncbi:permease [Alteriqipengyuania sp. WL0013]|uniref:CBU_0592 family membrane protein n=1 Tax=Alteriqipengyuania sp. WL0013 TaxID=3110773 RepID=UPI002C709BDC|nr:permease [Alteriqipengyuania sp. WL0013]MEB3414705.1 permease [Alteriqipengyuania sp. WL0013]